MVATTLRCAAPVLSSARAALAAAGDYIMDGVVPWVRWLMGGTSSTSDEEDPQLSREELTRPLTAEEAKAFARQLAACNKALKEGELMGACFCVVSLPCVVFATT